MQQVIHSIVVKDGKYIVMPVWYSGEPYWGKLVHPDPYVLDAQQQYPVGTKFVDGDRRFHYGYCHAKASATGRAMGGMKNLAEAQAITAKAVIHAVGETEIVLVDNTSTLNQWAGGYFMPRVHPYSTLRVLSNTAHDGTNVTLTLERGLLTAMASGEDGFLNQNKYSKLGCELPNAGRDDTSSMGVNLVEAEAGKWLWIQTWGPVYLSGGDELLGASADARMGFFHQDGTLYSPADPSLLQPAGYAINQSGTTATWYIQLQLDC